MKTATTQERGAAVGSPKQNRIAGNKPLGALGNSLATAGVSVPENMQQCRKLRYSLAPNAFEDVEGSPGVGVDLRQVVLEKSRVLVSFAAPARVVERIENQGRRWAGFHRQLGMDISRPALLAQYSTGSQLADMRCQIEEFTCQGKPMAKLSVMIDPASWRRITDLCSSLEIPVRKYLRWASCEASRLIDKRKGGEG